MKKARAVILLLGLTSCGPSDSTVVRDKETIVAKALTEIRLFSEFASLFPDSKHFISHIARKSPSPVWNSKTALFGRYILHLTAAIALDRDKYSVQLEGEADIELRELQSIVTNKDGTKTATYGEIRKISKNQWASRFPVAGIGMKPVFD